MTTTELKPCPFCGSKDVESFYGDIDEDTLYRFDARIACHGCCTEWSFRGSMEVTGSLKDIEEMWNRRVSE